jgi:hypothetical protein
MELLTTIVTSGAVSAAVAGIFKLWSDIDKSRRAYLSGILTEAYKREVQAYEDLWKEMFALQESGSNFLTTYGMSTDGMSTDRDVGKGEEKLKADETALLQSIIKLERAMEKNRPFFHRDVYVAVESFSEFIREEQWMRLRNPALYGMKSPPKAFDYLQAVRDMMGRFDQVSGKIRVRMTAPEEAFLPFWMLFLRRRERSS